MRSHGRLGLTPLALVGIMLVGGITYAAIPDSAGVIHGCYKSNKGDLRVIDSATTSCKPDEIPLSWNAQGVPGPQGVAGPQGPTGPQGPVGPQGPAATGLGSFRKIVVLHDDSNGHAAGWDPDGSETHFSITDPDESNTALVLSTVNSGTETSGGDEATCWADTLSPAPGLIHFQCNRPVQLNGTLVYVLIRP